MKILITGSRGQVGSQLINILNKGKSELGEIPIQIKNAAVIGKDSKELNIANFYNVKKVLKEIKPDIVINAAAYTNVDGCETNKELAFNVNAFGAKNLAIACEDIGAKIVHISTDYIFSGEGSTPFKESDEASPQSIYGISKNMGDNFVREFSSKHFIVRPSWVYGYNGKNFVYTVMKVGKERGSLKVVNDQRGNPTNVEDLSHHILKLIATERYGVYHCSGHGECTWYDFACKIIELSRIPCKVIPCATDEYPSEAKRPTYSSLDNLMLRNTVGDEMRSWEEALSTFIENVE
ncbi:dTDP-4-dehydrorhamnose reductase [Desnuesiella massiliensis]|uniref:dTDP-4-dehydrorhamnose reductase n=1 Tax=Desnuesiella massiliensis TaxID=1650662 RepID=UPI0006E449EF|nr:dTDP-4-dehydrorhamnose reductase [Desnuesiella massiliensis]